MIERYVDTIILLAVIVVAFFSSITFDSAHVVLPAGDTFNFINASEALKEFSYIRDERRLPTYPFLIMIGSFFTDPLTAANAIALLAGISIPVLLYAIGRKLNLHPLPVAIVAILAATEPHFAVVGARPLSDGLFIAMLLLLLFLYFTYSPAPTRAHALVTGFATALFLLIRPEGIAFATLIAACLFINWRKHWKIFGIFLITTIILLLPWFLINIRLYGTIWHNAYDDQIGGAEDSWGANSLAEVMDRTSTLATEGYWLALWEVPKNASEEALSEETPSTEAGFIIRNKIWWLSLLAWLGLLTMILNWKIFGVLLVTYAIEFFLISWWGPTFRFTSFIVPIWFLAIATSLNTLFFTPHSLIYRKRWQVGYILTVIFVIYILSPQVKDFAKTSFSRVSDNYGSGMSLVKALYYTQNLHAESIGVLEVNGITQSFLKERLVDFSKQASGDVVEHDLSAQYIILKEPFDFESHPHIQELLLRRKQYFPHSLEGDTSFSLYEILSDSER